MRVLPLVHLEDEHAPGLVDDEVRIGAARLGLEAAPAEGQVVLVLELEAGVAQELVDLEFLLLRPRRCPRQCMLAQTMCVRGLPPQPRNETM